jgi:hypothetical protein
LGYLYFIIFTVVRVVRKGFCRGSETSGPEQDALCSEAFDKDAVSLAWAWTMLLVKQKKGQ